MNANRRTSLALSTVVGLLLLWRGPLDAQAPDARGVDAANPAGRGVAPSSAKSPKEAARIDLTGYWVSIVSEDWRFRMVTPPKGDYPNVPLNREGVAAANAWDPVKDEAAADRCKAYGAPNIMRVPGRLHVMWMNDSTLTIDFDAGTQTRLLHFGPPRAGAAGPAGPPTRQGYSTAAWDGKASLHVVTTRLLPGYLQSNGVPFSAKAVMTEDFDIVKEPNGDQWLIVNAIVEDPQYLTRTFVRSTHFRKQADATGWKPGPCTVR